MKNGNKLICLVFVFAIIGWIYPVDNDGAIWVVNNTNLAPFVSGHGGTGERIGDNTTYWANSSPIQIFLWSHANTSGQDAEIHLYINGSKVADTSGRPLGIAEQSNKTVVATIPQYANYSVEMINFHHYEWREYPILTGTVTTNITTSTGTGAGCEGNCSFDGVWVNSIRKNNTSDAYGTYINLSAPFGKYDITNGDIFTHFTMHTGNFYTLQSTNTTSGNYSIVTGTSEGLTLSVTDTLSNNWNMYPDHTRYLIDTREYILNQSEFNVGNANITDVSSINNRNISVSSIISPTLQKNGSIHTQKILTYLNSTGSDITSSQLDNLFGIIFNYNPDIYSQNLITFQTISDGGWNYFQGRKARGTDYGNGTALLSAVKQDDILMRFSAAGYANGTAWTGARTIIDMVAAEDWNTTNQGSKIEIWATPTGSTTVTKRIIILPNGTINLPAFAGFGNGYVCYDNSGNWYRGTPGC